MVARNAQRLRRPRPPAARAARLCLCALLLAAPAIDAQTWRGALQRGGEIVVDPGTHRAVRQQDGATHPLWDGVHQLEDGSTVTVRDGVAVPTEDMYRTWRGSGPPAPVYAERWCTQLVRKTCGFDDACDTGAACLQARSLRADAQRERRELGLTRGLDAGADAPTASAERCRLALAEPGFPACESLAAGAAGRCRALVRRVCGEDDACADSQACDAARQLLALETEERLAAADPTAPSGTGHQCMEAMHNDFFTPCTP